MSPLEIELELGVDGTNIAARLVNVSKAATPVLHDPLLQPSRPILRDAEGNTIEPFDERSRAKFDNTVYRSMFVELGPGEHIVLGKAGFEHGKQGWSLAWGEFRFDELPSGSYELQIAWTSAIEQALSDADDSVVAVEGVWLGEVRSQTEALTLP